MSQAHAAALARARVVALACALASTSAAAAQQEAGVPEGEVSVRIESPAPGVAVSGNLHHARVTGTALAHGRGATRYDVMLVIDVSWSTVAASGADVDGDGMVGVDPHNEFTKNLPPGAVPLSMRSTDPQDTILHAQAAAARTLLRELDPRRVRVGIVTFSGEVNPVTGERKSITQRDARVEVELSEDHDEIERALRAIVARGAHGATNYGAGVRAAVVELSGLAGAESTPDPTREKVILFLSDGAPTFPFGKGSKVDEGDEESAIRAAELARRAGIVINTYALGPAALTYPRALTEMARVSRGTYTPVQRPGGIIALLGGVTFADVEDVVFTNLSTGDLSTDVKLNPDGTFAGYVPVKEGTNRVRVTALASDGRRGDSEFEFEFEHHALGARDQVAELERIRRQNQSLELQRRNLEIEAFRAEQRRRLEIVILDDPPDS